MSTDRLTAGARSTNDNDEGTKDMRETQPKVRLLAAPQIRWDAVEAYLREIDGTAWLERVTPWEHPGKGTVDDYGPHRGAPIISDAELLVEFAGRMCYRSWAPGLNANVSKVREDSGEYLANILRSKHGAVLEHAQFTFLFQDVSRVFTHELVRHRAGVAISQESLRYVRLTDLGFRIPDILSGDRWYRDSDGVEVPMDAAVVSIVEHLEEFQRNAAEAFGLDDDESPIPFHVKKEVTSALRRLAPLGLSTCMTWSANIRTLRHLIQLRTAAGAEEEIRTVFGDVARIMQRECPLLFDDFTELDGCWEPEWEKV